MTAAAQVTIEIRPPAAHANTVVIALDRSPGPQGSALYTGVAEAAGHPLLERLLRMPDVVSVMVKDTTLFVTRGGGEWEALLPSIEAAIRAHFAGEREAPTPPVDEAALWDKVWKLLDEQVNPSVAAHGGHIALVELRGSELWLQMSGGCQGCGAAAVTLREGVERSIRAICPEVTAIHDATDHAAGDNPYYR